VIVRASVHNPLPIPIAGPDGPEHGHPLASSALTDEAPGLPGLGCPAFHVARHVLGQRLPREVGHAVALCGGSMGTFEETRSALNDHLASTQSWDDDAERLTRAFTRVMLEGGIPRFQAAQELVALGLARGPAKQVVAIVARELGIPRTPNRFQRALSAGTAYLLRSRRLRIAILLVVVVPGLVVGSWAVYRAAIY